MAFLIIETPIGPLGVEADEEAVTGITFHARGAPGARPRAGVLGEATRQLDAYFRKRLQRFELPVAPSGTPFQLEVWRTLQRIPFGDTWSYADLARHLGRPDAVRAVGAANGRNPIPIVIPCHRVIGSNGKLVGFGGGLRIKRWLLELEKNRLFEA
jgi:methylated-DNA-[protein]-cysteine S-methyltransferase